MEIREDFVSETESRSVSESVEHSLAYRILEEDFSHVIADLNRHDRLGHYANEFQRVLDALRDSQAREHELYERNKGIRSQMDVNNAKLAAAAKLTQADQEIIDNLREEVQKAWKMIDAAQTREQLAQETIENLRLQSSRLAQELETLRKMGSEQDQESGVISKNKENLAREKERLLGEISLARDRYAIAMAHQDELEKKIELTEQKLQETGVELEEKKNELAKEKRLKQTLEGEMKVLNTDIATKGQEISNLISHTTQNAKTIAKLELHIREEQIVSDKQNKELNELQNNLKLAKMEYEQLSGKYEAAQQDVSSKIQEIKAKEEDMGRLRSEIKKMSALKESHEKKISHLQYDKSGLEIKNRELKAKHVTLEKQVMDIEKILDSNKKTIDNMKREKEVLTRHLHKTNENCHRQKELISLQELNKEKMQEALNEQLENVSRQKNEISNLQNEKDRLFFESTVLNTQIQEQVEQLKLKEMELFDCKKSLAAAESKAKLQMTLYEQVRSERNQLTKNLVEANDEKTELKHKLKVKTYQVEQLKEDIRMKEKLMLKDEFILKKVGKEKEEVKVELQKTMNSLKERKEQVTVLIQEQDRLQKIIQEADKDRGRLQKELNQVSNERDILGTQLVRRNDELSLLYEKVKIFQSVLEKGESQYEQRLEDIRLLKIEIKKLRQEKAMLARSINNVSDLRQELFHLERDFTKERLKCRALEEELQNPLNVHRWRKLEGSDPTSFELIQKVQLLQKRLLTANEEAVKKESQIKDLERLYVNLQQMHAKQPGPEIFGKLRKCQSTLKSRGIKMKCLVAELTMCEHQISGFKFEKEKTDKELLETRKKYYNLKKKEQKVKQRERELEQEKSLLPVLEPITRKPNKARFVGAGFNVASVACVPRTPSLSMNA